MHALYYDDEGGEMNRVDVGGGYINTYNFTTFPDMQHEPTTSRRSEDDSSELANGSIYPESSNRGKTQQAHPLKKHEALRECASYAALIPMAFFGVLIRLGMEALGDYDGRSVFPLIWAQGIGCAIMGTALELKGDLMQIYPPLFAAITTGLAGSITTFSSWMLDGFGAFANLGDYSRGGLYDTMDGVIYTLLTGAVAYACLLFGEFVGIALRDLFAQPKSQDRDASSTSPSKEISNGADFPKSYRRAVVLDCSCIALACLFYAGALVAYFVGSESWRPDVTFALLLGPPGALLRFVLAKLNPKCMFANRFPMGTFIANMLATGVLAASYVVQRTSYRTNLSITGCNAMIGIEQGFCGCLSTVSTFTVEAKSITSRLWKLIYVVSSVVLGHLLILAIVGGVKWSAEGLGPFCH